MIKKYKLFLLESVESADREILFEYFGDVVNSCNCVTKDGELFSLDVDNFKDYGDLIRVEDIYFESIRDISYFLRKVKDMHNSIRSMSFGITLVSVALHINGKYALSVRISKHPHEHFEISYVAPNQHNLNSIGVVEKKFDISEIEYFIKYMEGLRDGDFADRNFMEDLNQCLIDLRDNNEFEVIVKEFVGVIKVGILCIYTEEEAKKYYSGMEYDENKIKNSEDYLEFISRLEDLMGNRYKFVVNGFSKIAQAKKGIVLTISSK